MLHSAALNNRTKVVDWLRHIDKPYPPAARYKRIVNFNDNVRDLLIAAVTLC